MQNNWTDLNGLKTPMKKLTVSVTDVMVMDTAASLKVFPILSGTEAVTGVLLHAASMTNVSSIPIPVHGKKHSIESASKIQTWEKELLQLLT